MLPLWALSAVAVASSSLKGRFLEESGRVCGRRERESLSVSLDYWILLASVQAFTKKPLKFVSTGIRLLVVFQACEKLGSLD
jgi:hypothetical protein